MRKALAGDSEAYTAALIHITRMMRPYLSKRLTQKAEIEDILQEILISVHKARHTYDGKRPLKPWLFAIAKYRLQDHLRKCYADKLRSACDLNEVDKVPFQHVAESAHNYESIHAEINQLPGKQPQILKLLHTQGYTAREVASVLNMQESAVKVAAHRAYKNLRKKLVS